MCQLSDCKLYMCNQLLDFYLILMFIVIYPSINLLMDFFYAFLRRGIFLNAFGAGKLLSNAEGSYWLTGME